MKTSNIKRAIINKINVLISLFYLKERDKNILNKAIILPPDRFGSIGDEAMIMSVVQYLTNNHNLKSDILSFIEKTWGNRLSEYNSFENEIVINSKFGNPFNLFKILNIGIKYKYFIIIGADILDGHYSSVQSVKRILIGRVLSNLGVKVIVMGSSFNNNINTNVINELKKISNENFILNARDIESYKRIKETFGSIVQTLDVAYLLKPVQPIKYRSFNEFIETGDYISININPIHFEKYGESLISYFTKYITYILNETAYNIVLVPHDIRENTFGKFSDLQLLEVLMKKCNNPSRVFFYNEKSFISAHHIKYVAARSKMIITGRMHFAIASLSNQVPVLVMTYQGKFEGMLNEIYENIEKYIIGNEGLDINELISKSKTILSALEQEKLLIDTTKIKKMAEKNFDFL